MSNNVNVLIIGAGLIAKEYYKILEKMEIESQIISRGKEKAKLLEKEIGREVWFGNLETSLARLEEIPEFAIVATNLDSLSDVIIKLIHFGIKNILSEKPAGLNLSEIEIVNKEAEKYGANVYVAYNRRYFASTKKALEIIEEDGGLHSINFEFTEWGHTIEALSYSNEIKEKWLLANSSHVLDLAFFIAGHPVEMNSFVKGALPWHSKAAVFAGAGVTDKKVLFTYQANWDAPGRWGVELLTQKHRLYLRPLEKLQIQQKASIKIEDVVIDDEIDLEYKPGFYEQVKDFLSKGKSEKLLTITEHLRNVKLYNTILEKSEIIGCNNECV